DLAVDGQQTWLGSERRRRRHVEHQAAAAQVRAVRDRLPHEDAAAVRLEVDESVHHPGTFERRSIRTWKGEFATAARGLGMDAEASFTSNSESVSRAVLSGVRFLQEELVRVRLVVRRSRARRCRPQNRKSCRNEKQQREASLHCLPPLLPPERAIL